MGNMKDRNQFVDSMRGIAILLVVLGHTMTGCTAGAEESFLFNIVWSLQMPLFILISGYVTRYGKKISNGAGLWRYVKRRTLAYLLPWAVWSFLVRGIIFGQHDFLNVKWLLWHMDSGYWFLATIWTISLLFGLSAFFAGKIVKEPGAKQQAIVLAFYGTGMVALAAIGLIAGLSFFAIKLTLYYMPFYFAGYLYGQYREKILAKEAGRKAVDVAITVCLAAWLFVILRYRMYALPDSGTAILLRAAVSMAGCIAMCGLCKGVFTKMPGSLLLRRIGVHSLKVYLVHYLLLNLLKPQASPAIDSIPGIALITANYVITVALTLAVVKAIQGNRFMNLLLYGSKS